MPKQEVGLPHDEAVRPIVTAPARTHADPQDSSMRWASAQSHFANPDGTVLSTPGSPLVSGILPSFLFSYLNL